MGFKIEHRIGVSRPAAQVWAVLAELHRWNEWNPMYPAVSGKLLISEPLALVEKVGDHTDSFTAIVAEWAPNTQLIWTRRTHGNLVRQVRYIEMEALSDTGCIFSNGVLMEGWFAPMLISQSRRRALRAAFQGFGEAMKARVEASFGEDTEAWKG